jgi:hypothetical protein
MIRMAIIWIMNKTGLPVAVVTKERLAASRHRDNLNDKA